MKNDFAQKCAIVVHSYRFVGRMVRAEAHCEVVLIGFAPKVSK